MTEYQNRLRKMSDDELAAERADIEEQHAAASDPATRKMLEMRLAIVTGVALAAA